MIRIFISYGHGDATDFARKLADWLRVQGYEPWLDVENGVPVGAAFDVRIELGIQRADLMVALLSPWGLRPDGFCRLEILYAQSMGRPIIPVRLAEVVPPIQIISLNYIDASHNPDAAFAELSEAIRRVASGERPPPRTWTDHQGPRAWWAGLQPENFEEELARHGGRFEGRDWLFEEIRTWANEPRSRLLLITADAGFGKSAVAAQISARLNVRGVHFCSRSIPESCRPDRWIRGLVYQLAAQSGAYRERLAEIPAEPNWNESPEALLRRLVTDPLRLARTSANSDLSIDEPWLFVIDALDESWAEAGVAMTALLADSVDRLPDFLRIVITSRPDRDILAHFNLAGVSCRHLDADGELNRRDLERYVTQELESLRSGRVVQLPPAAADRVLSMADGNFLVARLSLEALSEADANSRLSLADMSALEPRLGGLYCAMFRTRYRDRTVYERDLLPLLNCLIAARGPLPPKLLEEASDLPPRTASRGLAALSQFLTSGPSGVRVFHQSLADWLREPGESAHFLASPESGHQGLAEIGWREYEANAATSGPYTLSAYALAHLPSHLIASSQWDRLVTLLTDLRYIEQRIAAGQVFDLIRDDHQALAALPESQAALREARLQEKQVEEWTRAMAAPLPLCRMWTDEEIEDECDRLVDRPTRADRLGAFAQLVSTQCYPLLEFGRRPGQVRQVAFNWEPAGPVRTAAAPLMASANVPWIERKWPSHARVNPKPALVRTLEGHSRTVRAVAMTANGRHAVTGSSDTTVRVWDLESGVCLHRLEGHTEWVNGIGVTPDGRRIVSGSDDKTIRIWDLETGSCLFTVDCAGSPVACVGISPDGRRVISGSADGRLRLWNPESSSCLCTCEGHRDWVLSASMTPDGRMAVSGGSDRTVRLWDLETGVCVRTFEGHSNSVRTVCVTADGRLAVTGGPDGTIRVWDLATGTSLWTIEACAHSPRSISATPDCRRIVSGGDDGRVKVWDLESRTCRRTLEGHSDWIAGVSVTPDGRRAVSVGRDRTVRVWNLESGAPRRKPEKQAGWAACVGITPDGRIAVSGSRDNSLVVWDLERGETVRSLEGHTGEIAAVCVTADGRRVISGAGDNTLRVWDLESGQCLRRLEGHTKLIRKVAVSADGTRAVSGSRDRTARVWDLERGGCLHTLQGHHGEVTSVFITPDGRRVISGSLDWTLRVWDAESGECIRVLEGHGDAVASVTVTPDGRWVISGSSDQTLRIWDLESGRCLRVLEGHRGRVGSLSVTPDGRFAVSGSGDKTLRIWDLESGECIAVNRSPASVYAVDSHYATGGLLVGIETALLPMLLHGVEGVSARGSAASTPGHDHPRANRGAKDTHRS